MINSLSLDFLTRLRNASLARRLVVNSPHSRFVENIASVLKKHKFVVDYSVAQSTPKTIKVKLSYPDNQAKITKIKMFSKPSRRLYQKNSSLPWGKTPSSLIIISTSRGLMSHKEAKKLGLGGELIAEIY